MSRRAGAGETGDAGRDHGTNVMSAFSALLRLDACVPDYIYPFRDIRRDVRTKVFGFIDNRIEALRGETLAVVAGQHDRPYLRIET